MTEAVAPSSNSEDSDPSPGVRQPRPTTLSDEWLDAHALTAERATAMLRDLKRTPPDLEPLDDSDPDSVDAAAAAFAADLNAKSLALLEFVCGDPKLQRSHCATPEFAAALAECVDHPRRSVRHVALESLVALAAVDERLVLPHVPRAMRRLLDPDDSLVLLATIRVSAFPELCAAAAEESDTIAEALAARGTRSLEINLAALECVRELGARVVERHAEALADFLLDGREDNPAAAAGGAGAAAGAAAAADDDRDAARTIHRPARGFAACAAALRALCANPRVAARYAVEVKTWTGRGGGGEVARWADRVLGVVERHRARLLATAKAQGDRTLAEGDDANIDEDEEMDEEMDEGDSDGEA